MVNGVQFAHEVRGNGVPVGDRILYFVHALSKTLGYFGACPNPGSQWKNHHHYFAEGPLSTLTTVTLFGQEPRDTVYRVRG